MSMKPFEFDRRYGELDQVISAYTSMPADDEPDRPSEALLAYLRHTWHTRPGPWPQPNSRSASTPATHRADCA
ncbi:hypothetical protein GCM10010216_24260 [Streptomyces flaveolus]|nr:hypothetical protein GCM10010216_24260 [Streptomyces flaveolus]